MHRRVLSLIIFLFAAQQFNFQLSSFNLLSAQPRFDAHDYSIGDGLPSNIVSNATQDRRGLMWFGTWRGLCCFDGYEFISFDNTADPEQAPLCTRIHSVKLDAEDNLWLVTYDRRAYHFDTHRCRYTDISDLLEKQHNNGKAIRVRNVYALDKGAVWLTCYDDERHLFRITGGAEDSRKLLITDEYRRTEDHGNIRKVVQDKQGSEWLETTEGEILQYKEGKNALTAASGKEAERARAALDAYSTATRPDPSAYGLPADTKLFIDRQGILWKLGNSLSRHTATPAVVSRDITPYAAKRLMRHEPAHLYAQITDSKGRLWQGYKDGGGLRLNGKPVTEGLQGSNIYCIYEDSRGHIWVACYDGGFNLVEETPQGIRLASAETRMRQFPSTRHIKVRHITETSDGVVILCTSDGIVCFSSSFELPEDIVFHSYTQSRRNKSSISGGNAMQALQASDGRIYISTMSGGLITVAGGHPLKDNLRFAPVEATMNTNGIVLSFIEDDNKCLWLARENYLEKYDITTRKAQIFTSRNLGGSVSFTEAPAIKDPATGEITMGVSSGAITFDPRRMTKSAFSPPILFSTVHYQSTQERLPILYAQELSVPKDKRNLTISFAALDYQDNSQIQYAYKLVGDGDDSAQSDSAAWNYVGSTRSASFYNLPPGHLRLIVRSTNADGVWTDNTAVLRIYSEPTFWETPWAWLLYLIIIIAVAYAAVSIVLMRQRHERERKEMEQRLEKLLRELESPKAPQAPLAPPLRGDDLSLATSADNGNLNPLPLRGEDGRGLPEEDGRGLGASEQMMRTLMEYINANISNPDLKISDLADAVLMSRSVFYEKLKAVTGMAPVDFLRYLRIQRAKQLLLTTDRTISQIAYDVGFSEPNYFGKVFKKATGMTPLSFRKAQAPEA